MIPTIDFETYSEAGYVFKSGRWVGAHPNKRGLPLVGAARYAEHPSTEILCLYYDMVDGLGPRPWLPVMPPPADLLKHVSGGGEVEAHHSQFEFYIWHYVAHARMGWPALPLSQLRCSSAKCKAYSLPGSLGPASAIVCPDNKKLESGAAVMRKLSVPRNPTKTNPALRYTPENSPKEFNELYNYCEQDVNAERGLSEAIPELIPQELALWKLDQRINARGVQIDVAAVDACINILQQAENKYLAELNCLTGGAVNSASELQKMIGWLSAKGVRATSLDDESVNALLASEIPGDCRRVLEIRKILSSSSVKKIYAIKHMTNSDGRLRGIFAYCGADRTGRWAGRGPQPQNLPRKGPKTRRCDSVNGCGKYYAAGAEVCPHCSASCAFSESVEWCNDIVEQALDTIKNGTLHDVEEIFGDPLDVISGCLRGLFISAPGKDLLCSDFSAIEGVVAAMLAREQWRIEVFRTHGKIYETGASKITGIPFDEFMRYKKETGNHHPTRQTIGKVSELASGFGGWINSWIQFGAGEFMTEPEIKEALLAWRGASPNIVEMWGGQHRKHPHKWEFTPEYYGLEGCAVLAIMNQGQCYQHNDIKYQLDTTSGALCCLLPSGRVLYYHNARLQSHTARNGHAEYQILYDGTDSEKTGTWRTMQTYGGKLFENVVQAVARDLLAHALIELDISGFPIVLHVHDEIVAEVPEGTGDIELFEKIMSKPPAWARDWPVKATGGWIGKRYRKE